jgi:hypothetical protein
MGIMAEMVAAKSGARCMYRQVSSNSFGRVSRQGRLADSLYEILRYLAKEVACQASRGDGFSIARVGAIDM